MQRLPRSCAVLKLHVKPPLINVSLVWYILTPICCLSDVGNVKLCRSQTGTVPEAAMLPFKQTTYYTEQSSLDSLG